MTDLPTDSPFQLLLRVRYGECDAQQVVFNPRYADYIDIAATEYLRAVCGGYQKLLEQGLDNQVVRLLINWKAPARFDDVLAIRVTTTHIGNTSFSLQMSMNDWHTGRLITLTEATYVMVNAKTLAKTPVPDDFRARLERGAPNVQINQAGVALPVA